MAPLTFPRKIALRYLWSKRSEAFITIITVISVLGVALGVMVLNVTMAVMTGFEHEIREKLVDANSHIVVKTLTGQMREWREVKAVIGQVDQVVSSSAFTYHQALLQSKRGATGILIRGVEQGSAVAEQLQKYLQGGRSVDDLFSAPPVSVERPDGDFDAVDLPGLIIGYELAQAYNLYPGDTVALLAPSVTSSPFGLIPRSKRFQVVGIYHSRLVEYESGLAYAGISSAQSFFRTGDAVSGIEVRVGHADRAPAVGREIHRRLDGISAGILVQDWTQTNKPLWEAMRLEKTVYFIVLLLIILMASFSIVSTLVMTVLEKRRDIAVLRTLGATSAAIRSIFILMGGAIGGVGTVAGLILGYFGCIMLREYGFELNEVFPVDKVPVRIEALNFVIVGLSAFVMCLVATIYPARRATRIEPSEVLRYE